MTGWKDWQIGEVVTESDFQNLVQDQVVQRYADAATRTSTLGTAIAEGMVSYLEDTNKVEVYDGSSWVQVGQEGDITSVTAGTGLTGGGTAGDVTLNADYAAIGSAVSITTSQVTDLTASAAAINTIDDGTAGYTALSNGTAGITYQPVSHNYIINGAFDVWQRGTSFGTATINQYTADRWRWDGVGVASVSSTTQYDITSDKPVAGATGYALKLVASATGDFNISQSVEDVSTLSGQTVTFSFYAKSDAAGNIGETYAIQDFGSGGSAGVVTALNATGNTTTSWQRFTGTATLPTTTGKTIGANNRLIIRIDPGNTITGTYYIWGVQLEAGSVATPFKRHAPSLQGELAACQRYYITTDSTPSATMIYGGTSSGGFSPNAYSNYRFPTQMRATPTITFYAHDGTAGAVSLYVSGSPIKSTSVASIGASPWGWSGNFAGNSPSWLTTADSGMLAFGFKAEAEL